MTPGADMDMDGFPYDVDCNDCSAQVNPGAFDEPGNGIDEDCDGVDAVVSDCDVGLAIGSRDPMDAARAMGLCQVASGSSWGVVSARYTTAAGSSAPRSAEQHGLVPDLGATRPVDGSSMLALSSGVARAPSQPGFTSECDAFGLFDVEGGEEPYPPGFPVASSACPGVRAGPVYNSVALEVVIRVPTNAFGFRFNSGFFTYEYPEFICDEFNDFFAVLRQEDGGPLENIVFDVSGEPVSVNNSLFSVCTPGTFGGRRFDCSRGRGELSASGFDGTARCGTVDEFGDPLSFDDVGGATGWLTTTAPVEGGAMLTLRFSIWDSGDADLDSVALIDGFAWELEDVVDDAPQTQPLI